MSAVPLILALILGIGGLELPESGRSGIRRDAREPNPRPNIVLLLADDLGYGDLGCYGSQDHRTPRLDALAESGVRFMHAYANAPNCAPTRAALMSGLYAPRTGVYTVKSSKRGKSKHRKLIPTPNRTDLGEEFVTIAEALGDAGYTTGHVGKWHLGKDPTLQGFQFNAGGNAAGHPKSYVSPYGNADLKDGPPGEYLTDRVAAEACGFIAENAGHPFFLQVAFFAVHTPIQGRPDLVESYAASLDDSGDAGYAAMVTALDLAIGKILDELQSSGVHENTVVVFFSDNGGHGLHGDNGSLRGSKGMLYEGGIREPMIVHWPGKAAAGTVCFEPVIGLDCYPTFLQIAGVAREVELDGVSWLPCLKPDARFERGPLFWHFPAYLAAYGKISESLPGEVPSPWRTTPVGAVREGRWKLLEFFEDGRLELYDLLADPGETVNRVEQQPETVEALLAKMRAWRKRLEAPVPSELNPEYEES